ncbi:sugar-phosphatase [Weissella paramesenteroides]|uniref:sugar-phosphatase n=1 Tax=Weissella paramesenteroides TaxID=1249 RepID=UPI0023F84E50|nr:sugar-phosphatase [Weissella paramesenteroides]MDF8375372.1 sugar-phosphatase [Weissella paramesenteroides]
MGIKLITIDIDDTLVNSEKQITPRVKQALQTATNQGVKVVLATGRPLSGVQDYLTQLHLANQSDQFAITYNGSVVQTTAGEQLGGHELSLADYKKFKAIAEKYNSYIQVESLSYAITANTMVNRFANGENNMVRMPLKFQPVSDMTTDEHYVKFMFIDEAEKIDELAEHMPQELKDEYYIVKSTPNFLEVMHKQSTKGNGLQLLADKLGIDMSETMALGDQHNDLTMIAASGIGVAMANAVPEVKAMADVMTTSQNEDGVGLAVEKWVLNQSVPELEN